ncbi:MAG TPA: hypothetical protein EYG30_00560 [Planctomycetes bacterium]|nr:hypothetical protein [Planctomycetota bacterium]
MIRLPLTKLPVVSTSLSRVAGLMICWLALLIGVVPRGEARLLAARGTLMAQSGDSSRERWDSMSDKQRERLRARFERLQAMETSERDALEERAKRLRKIERRVVASLSAENRTRLMSEPPEKRSQLLRELVEAEMRDRGQRVMGKLPSHVRDWMDTASPEELRKRLELFKRDSREKTSLEAVERVAQQLGFGPEEIARLQRLPIEERMQKVLELYQSLSKRQIKVSGLPQGITAQRWKELDQLSPRAYFAEIMALRAEAELGRPARKQEPVAGSRQELRQLGRDIAREMRPRPTERLELRELSREDRHSELGRRSRERVMRLVHKRGGLSAQQIQVLKAMDTREFLRNARRIVKALDRGKQPSLPRARDTEGARQKKGTGKKSRKPQRAAPEREQRGKQKSKPQGKPERKQKGKQGPNLRQG